MGAFYKTLTEAIDDVLHSGNTPARIALWERELARSAEQSLGSPGALVGKVRRNLDGVYGRLVERGGITKNHRGVDKAAVAKLRPVLSSQHARATAEAVDAVFANRDATIERTIKRFREWAESDAENRAVAKKQIRQFMASLPSRERHIIVDEENRLKGELSDIVADHAGAIAGMWRSKWRMPGYDYRPEHKARDELVYVVRGSWAMQDGLIRAPHGFTDDHEKPGEWRYCKCGYDYVYKLSALPETMLTARGRAYLRRNMP